MIIKGPFTWYGSYKHMFAAIAATTATQVKVHSHNVAAAMAFLPQWGQSVHTVWQTSLAIIVKTCFHNVHNFWVL